MALAIGISLYSTTPQTDPTKERLREGSFASSGQGDGMHLISEKQRSRLFGWHRRIASAFVLVGLAASGPSPAFFASAQEPDNTKTNQQDRGATADQQGQSPADRELTQKVRKSITSDKDLSTYAHNIKVVTKDGVVHLIGPVRSDEEKAAIEAKAVAIAGPQNVRNELTVKPKS
jgi:hyperosmotically inducible periplasmic protein